MSSTEGENLPPDQPGDDQRRPSYFSLFPFKMDTEGESQLRAWDKLHGAETQGEYDASLRAAALLAMVQNVRGSRRMGDLYYELLEAASSKERPMWSITQLEIAREILSQRWVDKDKFMAWYNGEIARFLIEDLDMLAI